MSESELTLLFTRRLHALGARYMVSGSVVVGIYGAPRLTNGVDLVARGILAKDPAGGRSTNYSLAGKE